MFPLSIRIICIYTDAILGRPTTTDVTIVLVSSSVLACMGSAVGHRSWITVHSSITQAFAAENVPVKRCMSMTIPEFMLYKFKYFLLTFN